MQVQLVDDALGEQVAEQVRPALAEQAREAALDQGALELGEVDAVLAEHQHLVVAQQRAGLVEVLGRRAGRHQHRAGRGVAQPCRGPRRGG